MSEPHGGSVLDSESKAWVLTNRGPQHVVACASCGQEFYSARLRSTICWGCWYSLEMETSAAMFRPLSDELERILEVKTSVDQTGGMTMCLRVPIGRPDGDGHTDRYAYFSEFPGDALGVGLYDDGDEDREEEFHEYPGEFSCSGQNLGEFRSCGWHHHPDLAKEVAKWAAPLIVGFADKRGPA